MQLPCAPKVVQAHPVYSGRTVGSLHLVAMQVFVCVLVCSSLAQEYVAFEKYGANCKRHLRDKGSVIGRILIEN